MRREESTFFFFPTKDKNESIIRQHLDSRDTKQRTRKIHLRVTIEPGRIVIFFDFDTEKRDGTGRRSRGGR